MKKWIVMLSLAMFGAGAMAQATPATPATPAADKAAPAKADSKHKAKAKKTSTKKKSHAPGTKDPMTKKGA
ncbi:hypothetical protein D9M69_309340 [compost metagenome]